MLTKRLAACAGPAVFRLDVIAFGATVVVVVPILLD